VTDGKTTLAFDVCLQTPVPFQDIRKQKDEATALPTERGTDLCALIPSSAQGLNEKSPVTGRCQAADETYRVHLQNINLCATRSKREKIPF